MALSAHGLQSPQVGGQGAQGNIPFFPQAFGDVSLAITPAIKHLKKKYGGLVFEVVQRLPNGKPGTAPKEWD